MTNRDKYKIFAVYPRAKHGERKQNTALLYVALGTKSQLISRWHELTDRGEYHMPLLFWQRLKLYAHSYKHVRYDLHRSFDWKPDALAYLEHLRSQYKHLLVEDLT